MFLPDRPGQDLADILFLKKVIKIQRSRVINRMRPSCYVVWFGQKPRFGILPSSDPPDQDRLHYTIPTLTSY